MKSLSLTISFAIIALSAMAQDRSDAAAKEALAKFAKLQEVQPSKNQNLGDPSVWRLGTPIKTAIIPLDKLREYKAGDPATQVIQANENILIYPVINSRTQQVITAITLENTKGSWKATSFGRETAVARKIDSLKAGDKDFTLVKLLAFNLNFLSYSDGGTLQFVPLQDDKERGITIGRPIPAAQLIDRYVQAAKAYNGLPL